MKIQIDFLALGITFLIVRPANALTVDLSLPYQIIIGLLIFLFAIPFICMIFHIVRTQVNKIQNANIFGTNPDAEYADDESEL